MAGSVAYGFVLGIAAVLVTRVAPQPAGSLIWWSFLAIQLATGSMLCWRRTALPFATAAMGLSALSSALLAVLAARGLVFPNLPDAWWPLVGASLAAGPILLAVEARVNRTRWQEWRTFMQDSSAWDIARGRHIPDLCRSSESARRP